MKILLLYTDKYCRCDICLPKHPNTAEPELRHSLERNILGLYVQHTQHQAQRPAADVQHCLSRPFHCFLPGTSTMAAA